MTKDIKTPSLQDLEKIFYNKLAQKAEDALIHQHDDEDVDDAIINGLDDD